MLKGSAEPVCVHEQDLKTTQLGQRLLRDWQGNNWTLGLLYDLFWGCWKLERRGKV
jgi:hypothetical protein